MAAVPKLDLSSVLPPAGGAAGDASSSPDGSKGSVRSSQEPAAAGSLAGPALTTRLSTVRFRWRRGRCLGSGHSSHVYEAMSLETGESLAVKQITIRRGSDAGGSQREAAALAALYHREIEVVGGLIYPHVVGYLGSEVAVGADQSIQMNIMMENCPLGSLRGLIDDMAGGGTEAGGLPELVVRDYSRQLLSGLNFLHHCGVAHRDIKAANVLLAEDADGRVLLKLADFGTARDLTRPPSLLSARPAAAAAAAGEAAGEANIASVPGGCDSVAQRWCPSGPLAECRNGESAAECMLCLRACYMIQ